MKKNIAMIIRDLGFSGAERVVSQLANMLSLEYHVYIITLDKFVKDAYVLNDTIQRETFDFPYINKILTYIHTNNIEIVIDHFHWGLYHTKFLQALQKNDIKHIVVDHNSFLFPMFTKELFLHTIRKTIYAHSNLIVSLTHFTEYMYRKNGQQNVTTIYNPVSYNSDQTTQYDNDNLIAVGNFTRKEKGLKSLLKTFAIIIDENNKAHLHIVGKVPQNINELITNYNIPKNSITMHGILSDVSSLYIKSSIFIFTSKMEGFGLVITEAGMHGLARVSFSINGPDDIIQNNQNGILVKKNDIKSLAKNILRLLNDKTELKRLGENARKDTINKFSEDVIKEQWINIINAILMNKLQLNKQEDTIPTTHKMIFKRALHRYNQICNKNLYQIMGHYYLHILLYLLFPIGSYRRKYVLSVKNKFKSFLN